MKLSICVVTMNRADQLKDALESCLACVLPDETEFVIIDNASTDRTEETVHAVLKGCGYAYYYEKLPQNIGAGRGRNYAFSKANGQYVYSLDDDAFISTAENTDFFAKALDVLDSNDNIVSLTSQIYDIAWKRNRIAVSKTKIGDQLYRVSGICEGSNFLRKSFFASPPYFPNTYGSEALPPVLEIFDAGKENCFYSDILAIHNPVINKWDYSREENHDLLIREIAVPYAIKKMMYPKVFMPVLFLAHVSRRYKHTASIPDAARRVRQIVRETTAQYPIKRCIRVQTVIKMFGNFGISVF